MIETSDFLRKVIAPEANKVLWINRDNTNKSWNENYTSFEDLSAAIEKYDSQPHVTPYLAVGTFHNNSQPRPDGGVKVRRTQEAACKFKALVVDIDVGEKYAYATQKDATRALLLACVVLKLPQPMVVASGRGIHAWWPFDRSIGRDTWLKMAAALQAALESQGVLIDTSKIKDPSMVLRAVGTHHKKDPDNWKRVRLLIDAPERPVMEYAQPLTAFKQAVQIIGPRPSKKVQDAKDSVYGALIDSGRKVPLKNLTKCPQLAAIIKSRGATDAMGSPVLEPLWRASLGVAKYTEDPRLAAYAFSSGHPDYDENATQEKMDGWRGTGPAICDTFDSMCPGGCDTCPFKGTIVSPAQIEYGTVTVDIQDPDTGQAEELKLPPGYVRKPSGLFYTSKALDEEMFVSHYFMWVHSRVTNMDESRNDARIMVDFPVIGVKEIALDSAVIAAGGNDLRKELASKQVYIKEDVEPLRKYLMTFLRKLQEGRAAETTFSRYGWQKDGSFLCGTGLLGASTVGQIHMSGVIKDMNESVKAEGDPEIWKTATRVLDVRGLQSHNFAVTCALAAPLLIETGTPSVLVNLYSPDSGSGKSTAGRIGLAAWGNPDTMPLSTRDTENAMYKKLGTYSCFGAYIDELTQKAVDPIAVRRLVMTLQSGVEPERLNRSTEGFRDKAKWWTPVISSSNHDLHELLRQHQMSSEAEQLRLFQLECPRTKVFEDTNGTVARRLNRAISRNYGHAGPALAAAIIAEGGSKALMERYIDEFEDRYHFLGPERFFFNLILCAYIATKLLHKYGIIKYDPMLGIDHAYKTVISQRVTRKESVMSGLDIVFQFLTENQDGIVYYHEAPGRAYALQPVPRKAVARVELQLDANDAPTTGMMWINKTALRNWARDKGTDFSQIVPLLAAEGVVVMTRMRRSLYKGVVGASATGQTYCIGLDVMSHQRLVAAASGGHDGKHDSKPRLEAVTSSPPTSSDESSDS